jgi:hypothetical protein
MPNRDGSPGCADVDERGHLCGARRLAQIDQLPDRVCASSEDLPSGDPEQRRDLLDRELLDVPQNEKMPVPIVELSHPATQLTALVEVVEETAAQTVAVGSVARTGDAIQRRRGRLPPVRVRDETTDNIRCTRQDE